MDPNRPPFVSPGGPHIFIMSLLTNLTNVNLLMDATKARAGKSPARHDKKVVRSVDRAVDILLEFIECPKMNAMELQQRLQLPKPTVYRLLSGLERRGLIYSFGAPRQYRLGVNALKLARAWSQAFDIGSESEGTLKALSFKSGETAALFLRQGAQERILIRCVRSPQALSYSLELGNVSPLTIGASGKCILAFLPEAEVTAICATQQTSAARMRKELLQTKREGYCITIGERIPGAMSMAAPIFGHEAVLGSIALLLPQVRNTPSRNAELVRELVTAARAISVAGGRMLAE